MESQRRVIRLVEKNGQDYRFYMKMKELMQEISRAGNMFIRIHCSYVVNYYYIKTFSATEVILLNGETLPVSTEYKNEAMKIYMDMVTKPRKANFSVYTRLCINGISWDSTDILQ